MSRVLDAIRRRNPWWGELAAIGLFYAVYSSVRNLFGSAAVSNTTALRNAQRIIDLEEALGLYVEEAIQEAFIDWTLFIQFWNVFYGLFHFVVTWGLLIWLFLRRPKQFPYWRTAGLVCTGIAVVGYAAFPLMPPRLLTAPAAEFGGGLVGPTYVDTAAEIGSIWSFQSGAVASVSNQWAAMPSLHIGWAIWSALAFAAVVDRRWLKVVASLYPLLTLFAIVVTANHYWIDGVGGAIVAAIGVVAANKIHGEHNQPT